jgi:chromosome segregation ATPase
LNRINTILLCITVIIIFYILKQEDKGGDISQYETQINILQQKVVELESANDSLKIVEDELEAKIASYDSKINRLNNQINVIKKETQAKLDSVDKFGDDELERFFANRYNGFTQDSVIQTNSKISNQRSN